MSADQIFADVVHDLPARLLAAGGPNGSLERMHEELTRILADAGVALDQLTHGALSNPDPTTMARLLIVSGLVASLGQAIGIASEITADAERRLALEDEPAAAC